MSKLKIIDYYNKHFPILETDRLILRKMKPEDSTDIKVYTSDESLYKYWGRQMKPEERNPYMLFMSMRKNAQRDTLRWGIELKSEGKIIGEIFLFDIQNERMGEIGFRIRKASHGKGICTEALNSVVEFCFTQTSLQRLYLRVMTENIPSNRVAEKCGFTHEGTIRQGKLVSVYTDYNIFGMLKADFEKSKDDNCTILRTVIT